MYIQGILYEGIVFIVIGILAIIIFRFYFKNSNTIGSKDTKDSND